MSPKKLEPKPEDNEKWFPTQLHLQVGDVLTSKKGILFPTMHKGVFQACERVKYLGDNHFVVVGEKRRRVDVVEVQDAPTERSRSE